MDTLMSDREADETDAFMDAIGPVLPVAYRLAYALVHSRHDVDDIVQEATLNAWRHRRALRRGSHIRPWFLAIVANQCRQAVRTRWWSVIRRPELNSMAGHDADKASDDVEDLRQGLRRLGDRDRVVLVLRYYLDLSFDDVAATLHISPQAARVRTHRALARLRPIVHSIEDLADE